MSGSEGRDDKLGGCAAAGVVEEEGGFTLNSHGRGGLRGKSVPRRGGRAGAGMWCKMECLAILVMACMSCAREGGCKESRDNGVLGEWASNPETISRLAGEFSSAAPFPHIVIPNFFSDDVASRIEAAFPVPKGRGATDWKAQGWHVYDNPIEGKLALDDVELMKRLDDIYKDMWDQLQSMELVAMLSNVTGIPGLENDPHLHGAGLHYHPPGSRLEMHLDYSIHPITHKERRVNLIIYMNRDWEEHWGGHLNLWEGTPEAMTRGPVQKISPRFNQAALFRTSDISWHGMPDPVACPEGRARKSVAIYYVSEPRTDATHRLKASYQVRPDDPLRGTPDIAGYEDLCRTRVHRRLNLDDIATAIPDWTPRWPEASKRSGIPPPVSLQ